MVAMGIALIRDGYKECLGSTTTPKRVGGVLQPHLTMETTAITTTTTTTVTTTAMTVDGNDNDNSNDNSDDSRQETH